ncbi:hypothetical protein MGLY_12430 [Neomoorella glycerini]|uniref:Uncharacterized protein n=1 Tax=Neomoorella glycerini TaxID=55779 RepID=A0A6I5ZQA2_9FIRM|nr:hypothetical protein [Moorella glycerini]QGP91896.1 hypothetical protein MGLY_12430 [Moorella glycerini]
MEEGLHFKEPVRTLTPATAATCIAGDNLSAATDHYGNYNNLCSTTTATWEARKDLSTFTNLELFGVESLAATMVILARPATILADLPLILRTNGKP